MDSIFLLKLTLSFFVGGSWILTATVVADKFGTKIGGLIAGLPSTLLFGLLFIGWTQTPRVAVEATTIVPVVGGINTLFLITYVSQIRKGLLMALLYSLGLWIILSFSTVAAHLDNFGISLLAYVLMFAFSYYIFEHILKIPSTHGMKIQYTQRQILFRGLLSGLIVALSVFFGKVGGPIIGGMFAMFPAMFTSTLVITYFTHGAQFSSAIAKSSMIGAVSVVIYSILVRYGYIPLGLILGTLLAISISFFGGYLIYKLVISKIS